MGTAPNRYRIPLILDGPSPFILGLPQPQSPIPDIVKLHLISRLDLDFRGEVPDLHLGCMRNVNVYHVLPGSTERRVPEMARLNSGIIMLAIGVTLLAVGWAVGRAISSSVTQFVLDGGNFQTIQLLLLVLVVNGPTISGLILIILGIQRAVRRTGRGWTIDII